MKCLKCGNDFGEGEKFCRKCGSDMDQAKIQTATDARMGTGSNRKSLMSSPSKDPDELVGNGIGSVIMGDGFFFVAVLLSFMQSPVSSFLWLILLIPASFFFGKGFTDIFQARQIRRRIKQEELAAGRSAELATSAASALRGFEGSFSGDLLPTPSVTDRTTRQLE